MEDVGLPPTRRVACGCRRSRTRTVGRDRNAMTEWVVTGSRPPRDGYTITEISRFYALFDLMMKDGDKLITGGCVGVDAIAMKYAHLHNIHVTTLIPINHQFTALEAVRLYSDDTIETGVGYWARDKLEVDRVDKVIALPLFSRAKSSRYSGTWHTWDLASKQGKASVLVVTRPKDGSSIIGPDAHLVQEKLLTR